MSIIFSTAAINKSPCFDSPEGWGSGFGLASGHGSGVVVGPGKDNPNILGQQFSAQPRQFFRIVARASSVTAPRALGCFQINWMGSEGEFLSASVHRFEVTFIENQFQQRVCAPENAVGGVIYVTPGSPEDVVRYAEMSLYSERAFSESSLQRIADSEKAVFVNLARTGGTSLARSITEHYDEGQAYADYGESAQHDEYGHLTIGWFLNYLDNIDKKDLQGIRVFLGHLPYVDKARLRFKARYFTAVRNPITRMISSYSYGNLDGLALPFDFFSFGLHVSVSWSESLSFQNPMSKVLLSKTKVGTADIKAIEQRIEDFVFIGITEDMAWTTDRILELLGKGYPTVHHINRTPEVSLADVHPATIQAIKFRNWLDIHLYNKVCEKLNEERRLTQLPPLAYCLEFDGGPFSSGDYHPDLSSLAAFDDTPDSAWLPCTLPFDVADPYLGYDFGKTRRECVRTISIQPIGPLNVRLQLAVEASDDGFVDDIRPIAMFGIPVNDQQHRVRITKIHDPARMWRIKILGSPAGGGGIAVASLSFGEANAMRCKDGDLVRENLARIVARYNQDTYERTVEAIRQKQGVAN